MLPGELARAVDPAGTPAIPGPAARTPRDWAVDVAFFAVAVLVGVGEFSGTVLQNQYDLPAWLRVLDPVLGVALCVALWWRRRFPVALGLAAAGAMAVSNTAAGAGLVLLFSLALHRGWTTAVPVTGLAVLLGLPYIITVLPPVLGMPALALAVILTLLMLLVLTAGLAVRARRQLVLVLRLRADEARREEERRQEESRRAERERIAREMHDVLAHRISLLSVHAGALEYRTADGAVTPLTAGEVHDAARVVRAGAHQALEELRDVLQVLRHPDGDPQNGDAAGRAPQPDARRLPALLDEARRGGQRVHGDLADGLAELRPQLQRTVYRVVQEGLTNARKHAPGAEVQVTAAVADGEVHVEIANPAPLGVTTSEIPGAGAGLTGLAERVALHGGELTREVSGGRFRLAARIPSSP